MLHNVPLDIEKSVEALETKIQTSFLAFVSQFHGSTF